MIKRYFIRVMVPILLVSLFGRYASFTPTATAQSSLDPWTTPVNLSQSGATSEPAAAIDSNGNLHVIWYDAEAEAFLYTRLKGDSWTEPDVMGFALEQENPYMLLADTGGNICIFWINEDNLLLSSCASVSDDQKPAWSRIQTLGVGVVDFHVSRDQNGFFHLAYIRTLEAGGKPAGIYYMVKGGAKNAWSKDVLLYESRYFRSLTPDNAYTQVSTTQAEGNTYVYVTWDNRPMKQVYLAKSEDGGENWDPPVIIDGPIDSSPTEDPFHLQAHAYGSNVLLIWQNGLQSGFDCTQFSQYSPDLGVSWNERRIMFKNIAGCPQENRFFDLDNGLILMSTIQEQVYLTAWNGQEWSEPQPQSVLSGFTDHSTFNTVLFRCYQTILSGSQLYVVGCDIEGDGDIWLTTRELGVLTDWFGESTGWKAPAMITSEQRGITSPIVLCDSEDIKHVLWSQAVEDGKSIFDKAIYYAKLDENSWTTPTLVLNSPDVRAAQPEVVFDNRGNLIAVWSSSDNMGIYSSFASIDQARNAFNWSEPVELPSIRPAASAPDVQIDPTGKIFVVYAIRVNEDRGIYLTSSEDGGKTWSLPIKAFDAAASNWSMVDQPKLAQTADGMLHLLWTQNLISERVTASALYYANSDDGGQTWSQPQLLTDEPLGLGMILSPGDRTIDAFWLSLGNAPGIFHQFSINGGENWNAPVNTSGIGEVSRAMDVIPDQEGRLHLVQAIEEDRGLFSIKYLVWNGARWFTEDSFYLGDDYPGQISALDICLDSSDQLATVFTLLPGDESSAGSKEGLYFTSHLIQKGALEAPALTQLVLPTQGVTTTLETAIPVALPTPAPTESQALAVSTPAPTQPSGGSREIQTASGFFDQPWAGLALGLGIASIIVISSFVLILRRRKRYNYH